MVPLYVYITMLGIAGALMLYGWYDHRNRIYANIVAMFMSGVLFAYLGTIVSTYTVYDAWYCTYNETAFSHSCVEFPFNSPSLGYFLGFVATAAFIYTVILIWEAWNEYQEGKADKLARRQQV